MNAVALTFLAKVVQRGLVAAFAQLYLVNLTSAEPQIWLAPLSNVTADGIGEADFMDLAKNERDWRLVESRTRVFKMYPFFVGHASDDTLKTIIDEMRRHDIALALEARVLSTTHGCEMSHGDGGEVTIRLLRRVKKLGGEVTYLAMDEPLKHALTGDARCRASIDEMARDAAARMREFRAVYPRLKIGDIEPIGTWSEAPTLLADTLVWIKAYALAAGEPLTFFHADVGWNTQWLGICTDVQRELLRSHIPFGMIYNGTDTASTAAIWADQANGHFRAFEAAGHPAPDAAIFQSWRRFPDELLPETNSTTLSGIAAAYISYHRSPQN